MSERSICILGATGFVGRALVPELANRGHSLTLLTRNRERHRDLLVLPSVTVRTANVYDPATLEHHFRGCDAVINMVGILNEKGRKGDGFQRAHFEVTRLAVDACRAVGVSRFMQLSSLKADAENGPSHYLRSKGQAEDYIRKQPASDLDWTIFQPSVIFGPGDSFANRFANLLRRMPLLLPLAKPDARMAPVYIKDVVAAMSQCLFDPGSHGQTYQLCGPNVYSLREIVHLIAGIIGVHRYVLGLPDGVARLQAAIMDFVPGKPFSTDNYLSLTVPSVCEENGFERLGIRPHSAEAIMPRYLRDKGDQSSFDRFRRGAAR